MKKFVPRDDEGILTESESYLNIDQHKSSQGLVSIIMGIISLILLIVLFVCSYTQRGEAGVWIGWSGIGVYLMSLTGLIFAALGLKDKEAKNERSYVGLVLNGIVFVWLTVLYWGNL